MLNSIKFVVFTLFVFSIVTSANPAEDKVKDALSSYISSVDDQNVSALNDIIMVDANFVVMNKISSKMDRYTTEDYVNNIKKGKFGGWKRTYEISSLYVTDDMAIARVNVAAKKMKQSESITFLKVGGEWKVSNSTLTLEKNK